MFFVDDSDGKLVVTVIGPHDVGLLKTIFRRALNTWNDAPPQAKRIHDHVIFGGELQSYNAPNQGNPPRDG